MAERYRASPRYIQGMFESAGLTFSEFLLDHLAGFGDVSYVHRSFARRFGGAPSELRRSGLDADWRAED